MAEGQSQAEATVTEGESSLLDEVLSETKLTPGEEAYTVAKQGIQAFVSELVKPHREGAKADRKAVDAMIDEIDQRLTAQVNEILHHPDFQKLERTWRGLHFLMKRVNFRENIRIEMVNISKEDLAADFEDAPDMSRSGLFKLAYSNEYGQFGGEPYGAICAQYEFGPNAVDMQTLSQAAAVAAVAHAPFLTNAGSEFFGTDTFEDLPKLKDLSALMEGPQYTKWHSFRENPDSCYVGLCMPRFMLRLPWGGSDNPIKSFNFKEEVVGQHENYCWGHASVALTERVADSFAQWRWCPNIIGPQAGGTVKDLPLHQYEAMGEIQTKVPTEVMLTERREYELAEEGFIALTYRKDSDNACFFSANSVQKPKFFGTSPEAREAETNFKLGTQLPYMFVITRLAHYLKVMQREQLGSWKDRTDLQSELNTWISQYVSDMENPDPSVRSRKPMRKAEVIVEEVEGQPGWFKSQLKVQPHIKYMGSSFELSLVGRLDK